MSVTEHTAYMCVFPLPIQETLFTSEHHDILYISCKIATKPIDINSTSLDHIMAWCHQAMMTQIYIAIWPH